MEIERKAFLSMLVLGTLYGIVHSVVSLAGWWLIHTLSHTDYVLIIWFLNLVEVVTWWVLLFIVLLLMYNVGKKFDLKTNLKTIVISMLLGGFIGYFLVTLVTTPLQPYVRFLLSTGNIETGLLYGNLANYVVGVTYNTLEETAQLFFAGFTAITIAHFRKTREKQQPTVE